MVLNNTSLRQCCQKWLSGIVVVALDLIVEIQRLIVINFPPFLDQHLYVFPLHVLLFPGVPPRFRSLKKIKPIKLIKIHDSKYAANKCIFRSNGKITKITCHKWNTYCSTIVNHLDFVKLDVFWMAP